MRIVELKAENFKRLVAIAITPKGDVIIISGKNRAGKTCAHDIIWAALGGAKGIPKEPIRKGQDRAVIEVDLGEYKATRVFTKKGNYLRVENKEGMVFKSPEALLDKMIGDLTFDPLEFVSAKNRDEILLNLVGLKETFDKIKLETDEIYVDRKFVNRQVKQMEGQLEGYRHHKETYHGPKEVQPNHELIDRLRKAREKTNEIFHMKEKLNWSTGECEKAKSRIDYLEKELEKAKEDYESQNAIRADRAQELSTMKEPDIANIESEINNLTIDNEKARIWKEYRDLFAAYNKLKDESDELTRKLNRQSGMKIEAIEKAKFPIEGLSYDEGILYNGIPFEQISASEKLRVSMAVAMALNPKIRVIRITDGSLLDSENMKIIEELAKENDYQIWVEKVDETGKVGIYIEEGEVKADNQEK